MEQQKKKRTAGICLTSRVAFAGGFPAALGNIYFRKGYYGRLACDGAAAFGGSTFGFDGLFADEKTDGGYLEKSCGQKAALDFFCFWYAELSVYLFCGHPIFQCRHGNGVAVLGAFADFGGCVLQGKALAS